MKRKCSASWLRVMGPMGMGRPRRWTVAATEALGRKLAEKRRWMPFRERMRRRPEPEFRRVVERWLVLGLLARSGQRR